MINGALPTLERTVPMQHIIPNPRLTPKAPLTPINDTASRLETLRNQMSQYLASQPRTQLPPGGAYQIDGNTYYGNMEWTSPTPQAFNGMGYHDYSGRAMTREEAERNLQNTIDDADYAQLLNLIDSLPMGDYRRL